MSDQGHLKSLDVLKHPAPLWAYNSNGLESRFLNGEILDHSQLGPPKL